MKKVFSIVLVIMLAFAFGCAKTTGDSDLPSAPIASAAVTESIPSQSTFKSTYKTFGPHFQAWLNSKGYSFGDGGFGGYRTNAAPAASKRVVIFIHGNSSRAHGGGSDSYGWYNTYKILRDNGWNNSELYAVNYGYESALMSGNNDHSSTNVNRVKDFINAVYAYVGNKKVTVVSHSLGVTVSRKAMKDGNLYSKVETFIAIAGGNRGLPTCGSVTSYYTYVQIAYTPTCSSSTGFLYPPSGHYYYQDGNYTGYPNYFIGRLNSSSYGDNQMSGKTTRTYVIMSLVDEIAGVRASYTSKLNGAYKYQTYSAVPYGHFNAKNLTASVQLSMINRTF